MSIMGDLHQTEDAKLRALELEIDALRTRVEQLEPKRARARREHVMREFALRRGRVWAFRGEQWTGRVGVGLLFLGLVFLFRHSIEQGWITPGVRVLFGVSLGLALLAAGLNLSRSRASYAAILLAASLSSFYATGWAASYLYQLIDRPIAYIWMTAVTLLAFGLSQKLEQPALGSLGALAGFATPFLLRPGSETAVEVVAYSTLVVLWAGALYVTKRWRSVLWTYLAGGLGVLSIAAGLAEGGDRLLVQSALLLSWAAGAYLPFFVEQRAAGGRNPYPRALVPYALELRLLGAGGSAAAVAVTGEVWALTDAAQGTLFIALAVLYALFAWIGSAKRSFVASSAAPVAGALLATSIFLILPDGAARWGAVAALAAASLFIGAGQRFEGLQWVAHGLFALLAINLLGTTATPPLAPFDARSMSHLLGIVLASATIHLVRSRQLQVGYRWITHGAGLLWLWSELTPLSQATEMVTVGWGGYGFALLLLAFEVGRRTGLPALGMQALGGSAVALAVLKLLVIDMAQVTPLVRIPLFIGSGIALLLLSPLFHRAQSGTRSSGTSASTNNRKESSSTLPRDAASAH